jgi:Domain of unknown function (DUF4468) with TBP-like fold
MFKFIVICVGISLTTQFIACTLPPQATEMDKKTEDVIEVKLTKAEIYNKCLQWMATTFVSSKHVIELQDSAQGVIIGNGIVDASWQSMAFVINFTLRIDIKDQKYRFKSFNYIAHYGNTSNPGNLNMSKELADRTRDKINELEKSLFTYLSQNNKSNDF